MKVTSTMSTVLAVLALSLSASVYAEGELKVTNWGEYIGENTIANFEKEFDIKVIYDNYDSAEAIDTKLLAGNTGYDVVIHSSSSMARLIPANILMELDKTKLPNLKNMREEVMGQVSDKWDPGNKHIIPYMWGSHGVTYNAELIKSVYPEAPIGSMDLVFDPIHMEKIAKCGVAFLDSPGDIMPMALAHMGFDPNSTNKDDYKKVEEMLMKVRPFVKTFDNYAYQRMPQKEFCLAITWGPDGLLAMSGAEEAGTGVVLDFFLPPGEGKAQFWTDGWMIPSDAKNIENAHLFLNYMMRPEVGAHDTETVWYATANKESFDMIDKAITSSKAAFPTQEQVEKMYTVAVKPKKIDRAETRAWTNFKAGN